LQSEFQRKSVLFRETGGVHSAALANGEAIRIFMADIGRHNAIDKVIGKALLSGLNLADLVMLTSGRISSEIVLKVAHCGTPILVSRSAPTDRAVEMAKQVNLTVIGFARGSRMNIYSGEERIS
jgi:FdhD protein